MLLGLGDGTFAAGRRFAVGNHPGKIIAGDFNADGRLDLAVSNDASSSVSTLLNNTARTRR